jgi:hypothetical protein
MLSKGNSCMPDCEDLALPNDCQPYSSLWWNESLVGPLQRYEEYKCTYYSSMKHTVKHYLYASEWEWSRLTTSWPLFYTRSPMLLHIQRSSSSSMIHSQNKYSRQQPWNINKFSIIIILPFYYLPLVRLWIELSLVQAFSKLWCSHSVHLRNISIKLEFWQCYSLSPAHP